MLKIDIVMKIVPMIIISCGFLSFLLSGFRSKYLSSSIVLGVGIFLMCQVYRGLVDNINTISLYVLLGFLSIGIFGASIEILISKDYYQRLNPKEPSLNRKRTSGEQDG